LQIEIYGKDGCGLCQTINDTFLKHFIARVLDADISFFKFCEIHKGMTQDAKVAWSDAYAEMAMEGLEEVPAVIVRGSEPKKKVLWARDKITSMKDIPFGKIIRASNGDETELNELQKL